MLVNTASNEIRNKLMTAFSYGLFLAFGQLSSAIALQIVNVTHALSWRRAIYSEWALIGPWTLCLPFIVESPWYFARKHQHDNAKAVLAKLYRNVTDYDVDYEYQVMRIQLENEEAQRRDLKASSVKEIFTTSNLRRTMASFFGVVILQWSGTSVVFSYATCKFKRMSGTSAKFKQTSCNKLELSSRSKRPVSSSERHRARGSGFR